MARPANTRPPFSGDPRRSQCSGVHTPHISYPPGYRIASRPRGPYARVLLWCWREVTSKCVAQRPSALPPCPLLPPFPPLRCLPFGPLCSAPPPPTVLASMAPKAALPALCAGLPVYTMLAEGLFGPPCRGAVFRFGIKSAVTLPVCFPRPWTICTLGGFFQAIVALGARTLPKPRTRSLSPGKCEKAALTCRSSAT